jgi:hypothetical protein
MEGVMEGAVAMEIRRGFGDVVSCAEADVEAALSLLGIWWCCCCC